MRTLGTHAMILSLLVGCTQAGSSPKAEDGENDTLQSGSFNRGLTEGTPEACGVLHVANTASFSVLYDDVYLSYRAATAIVRGRPYATLAALDAVPYVGGSVFNALLEYAEENGDVEACKPATPDAPPPPSGPSELDCFWNWRTLDCPAPVITAAYLSNSCQNTSGVTLVGHYFQNKGGQGQTGLALGPVPVGSPLGFGAWNELTPMHVCLTTSATPGDWSGFPVQLQNADGKLSNTVTVENLLPQTIDVPSSSSPESFNDPFDPDTCNQHGMTDDEALAKFAPGTATAQLGTLQMMSRSRTCNAVTGCAAWGPGAADRSLAASLFLSGVTKKLQLGGADCSAITNRHGTAQLSVCDFSDYIQGPHVYAHVAASCLRAERTVASDPDWSGTFTQTNLVGLLRY